MSNEQTRIQVKDETSERDWKDVGHHASDLKLPVQIYNALVPDEYDYISLSYTGSNLTGVVFKSGGSGGTTVATLTLSYTGSVLDSVTKT